MSEAVLSMQGIVKEFPGVLALNAADLSVLPGEVHGLVGENGAGKSTIIKVLAGIYPPNSGVVSIGGQRVDTLTPEAVHKAGVRFIHQELYLVPHFTVAESVFMGQEISGPLGLSRRQMRTKAEAFFRDTLDVDIRGNTLIRDLGTAERKLVQIARALIDNQARLVVFDEPTAPLASDETYKLFGAIHRLKERGIAIIYVSHYLSEITDICDRVTVFRNGQTVAVFDDIHEASAGDLIKAMVGREIDELFPQTDHVPGTPALHVTGLGDGTHFRDIDFTVHGGEILGIAGLIGSGREALVDTIYGLHRPTSGKIVVNGEALRGANPAQSVAKGLVLVPRDRRNDGLVLDMSVSDNINLASLDEVSLAGLENRKMARTRAERQIEGLDIRPDNPAAITRLLSGGNQQKVVLGRWLATDAQIFLMEEPTVGVDVGAKVEIYQLIANLAQKGVGILMSSSDPGELIGMCDRILVMMRGRITHEVATHGLSIDQLVAMTTGATSDASREDILGTR